MKIVILSRAWFAENHGYTLSQSMGILLCESASNISGGGGGRLWIPNEVIITAINALSSLLLQ